MSQFPHTEFAKGLLESLLALSGSRLQPQQRSPRNRRLLPTRLSTHQPGFTIINKVDYDAAIAAGFQWHLAKPVKQDQLLSVVAALAGRTKIT
jgi:CheY-like chemotaxis protein